MKNTPIGRCFYFRIHSFVYTTIVLNLPTNFILFDLEFTAWEGSQERNWSAPGEHREVIQIGAINVVLAELREEDMFQKFVQPKVNASLSDYIIALTGITDEILVREGINFPSAVLEFKAWCADLPCYSYGNDGNVIAENCALLEIENPFPKEQFHNIRNLFKEHGIPANEYTSGTIVEAFGEKPVRLAHDAVNDARSILDGLVLLNKKLNI